MVAAALALLMSARALAAPAPARAPYNDRALKIARACGRPEAQLRALKAEAGKIKDKTLRAFSFQALDGPAFPGLEPRRAREAEIAARLFSEGLLASSTTAVFPAGEPMPFLAAPGNTRLGHHSYPGGLIDHTLFNLRSGLGLADAYEKTFGVRLNRDLIRAAAIRHDAAKPWTMPWQKDGAPPEHEGVIAGTGAHHIMGVAEAVADGLPPRFIVVLASAHAPPTPGNNLKSLLGFLRASAIIAGKPYAAAGLTDDGTSLREPPPLEAFVAHLDDHDWVLTETTMPAVVKSLAPDAGPDGPSDMWALDPVLCKRGDIFLYRQRLDSSR